jgi:hypothetical protein
MAEALKDETQCRHFWLGKLQRLDPRPMPHAGRPGPRGMVTCVPRAAGRTPAGQPAPTPGEAATAIADYVSTK